MPAPAPRQPTLHKPKSKLRLRLGLTPPHPHPTRTKNLDVSKANPHMTSTTLNPAKQPLGVNTTVTNTTAVTTKTTTAIAIATESMPIPKSVRSPTISPILTSSTSTVPSDNTFSTLQSRTDSRHAFAYDNDESPSPVEQSNVMNVNFDTISYASDSPASVAFDIEMGRSSRASNFSTASDTYHPNGRHDFPLSPPFASPEFHRHHEDQYYHNQYIKHNIRLAECHPNLAAAANACPDVFAMTDQQLHDRFKFHKEIGFGNWGSVWECRIKPLRSSIWSREPAHMAGMKLGRMSANSEGGGAGGKVAIKVVDRRDKTHVSIPFIVFIVLR
jgi:protein-serine/threonine kinase